MKKCFLLRRQKANWKVNLCRKYHYPLWKKLNVDGDPQDTPEFLFSEVVLLSGPWHTFLSNIAVFPSETLIRSSGGPSIKEGVGNSIQITQTLRSRGIQGRQQSLSLFSPSPSFLVFNLPTSVSRGSFHSTLFQGFWESNLKKTPLVGRGVQLCQRLLCLTSSTRKTMLSTSHPCSSWLSSGQPMDCLVYPIG